MARRKRSPAVELKVRAIRAYLRAAIREFWARLEAHELRIAALERKLEIRKPAA